MKTWIAEAALAKELHLSRFIITNMRRLHLDHAQWKRGSGHGRKIVISEQGANKLRRLVEGGDAKCDTPPDHTAHATKTPAQSDSTIQAVQSTIQENRSEGAATVQPVAVPQIFTVTQILMNPYLLDATDVDGKSQRIRVQTNAVYSKGDKLKAIPDPTTLGIYMQIGPRPRFKRDRNYALQIQD